MRSISDSCFVRDVRDWHLRRDLVLRLRRTWQWNRFSGSGYAHVCGFIRLSCFLDRTDDCRRILSQAITLDAWASTASDRMVYLDLITYFDSLKFPVGNTSRMEFDEGSFDWICLSNRKRDRIANVGSALGKAWWSPRTRNSTEERESGLMVCLRVFRPSSVNSTVPQLDLS